MGMVEQNGDSLINFINHRTSGHQEIIGNNFRISELNENRYWWFIDIGFSNQTTNPELVPKIPYVWQKNNSKKRCSCVFLAHPLVQYGCSTLISQPKKFPILTASESHPSWGFTVSFRISIAPAVSCSKESWSYFMGDISIKDRYPTVLNH